MELLTNFLTNTLVSCNYNILIDNKKVTNAWCMPGGKIAVYTGMLEVTKNTNALAAVMGHEIAHAVAKHSVERASRSALIQTGTQLIDIFSGGKLSQVNRATGMDTVGLLQQIGIMNPFTRNKKLKLIILVLFFHLYLVMILEKQQNFGNE